MGNLETDAQSCKDLLFDAEMHFGFQLFTVLAYSLSKGLQQADRVEETQ